MQHDILAGLLEATLASSIAIVLVLLLRLPLRRAFGAQSVRGLWLIALLAPLATLLPAPKDATLPLAGVTHLVAAMPQASATAPIAAVGDTLPWGTLLLAAWAAGMFVSIAVVWRKQRVFLRTLGPLTPLGDGVWQAASPHGTPALVGVAAPRIVVPQDFQTRYNAAERDLVLAHERTHRAVGDTVVNALATLLRCVFWFNPLVHAAAALLRFDQELACDASVLARHPQSRRRYAEALLKTQAGPLLPIGCQWRAGAVLVRRVHLLAAPSPRRARRIAGAALAIVLSLSTGVVAWATQTAQPGALPGPAEGFVEARIVLRPQAGFGQMAPEQRVAPQIVARAGEPFAVRMGEGAEAWELRGTATPLADGGIGLRATLRQGGVVRMEHDEPQTEGQTLFLRTGSDGTRIGAVAEITLWRASDARAPAPRELQVRAHGRVMARHGDRSDAGFFDGAPGHEFDIAPSPDSPLRISYRIDNLTADTATIHATVERKRDDGSIERLAQPVLVTRRGNDASIRIDLRPTSGAVESIATHASAVEMPMGRAPEESADMLEVTFTVDPA